MARTRIKEIQKNDQLIGSEIELKGWVRTVRNQKTFCFIEINDGSTLSNFQIVANAGEIPNYDTLLAQITTGASISVKGKIVQSPGKNQSVECQASSIEVLGTCSAEEYLLQKKRHSFEFLRTIAHLRPRTNTLGAVARVRSALAFATHKFFQEKGFLWINTPIITASDCEGAGKMFQVTTLEMDKLPKNQQGQIDYSKDFFEKPAFLTVSGQLNGEIFACALSDVYTFGPTFRAENSNTSRHLAEFWMIEPEMAFADIFDNMDCAEAYLKYVIKYVLENCAEDMEFFNKMIAPGLLENLTLVMDTPFERVSYTKAIEILEKSNKKFEYPVKWGTDLQSEHERYLAEEYFKKPVILIDYPQEIKAFYMRSNEDGKTVAAMDVLVPKIGEIIGGSQREERLDVLLEKMKKFNLHPEDYWWYLELRKYGSVPHAGFGVGFERLVQFATGMENIRDVNPFPRYPGKADF
ncbi:Asparagine--tRNA ligase [Candidatus Rubidus massiliensis]|mgnify:CR=1 FL=1|nr:MAG: asparagine--tRNA ligase [Chlamydia sp. 32-24]CDZ80908.1 Asparagine--tRNA ligase [Candidatus Rubidus massiliensis]